MDNGRMPEIATIDVTGRKAPLKEFFSANEMKIWFFHDSIDLLPKIASFGALTDRTMLYFSNSWFVSQQRARRFRHFMRLAQEAAGPSLDISRNVVLIANSELECVTLRSAFPAATEVILVNNTSFLDTETFNIIPHIEKKWRCIINSKPFPFKRLHLSSLIQGKAFITYMTETADRYNTPRVSLLEMNASAIFRNVADSDVAGYLNQSKIGAILSEEEGACYANTEYLLCGLPVVSTPSRGGRDIFYDETTAVICQPEADDVARAVQYAEERLDRGEITSTDIRRRTLDRILGFRETLIGSLQKTAHRFDLEIDFEAHLKACLQAGNKMQRHRNFFLKDVELA
jgi:hypothetical protein